MSTLTKASCRHVQAQRGKQECVSFDIYFSVVDVFTCPSFPSTHTTVGLAATTYMGSLGQSQVYVQSGNLRTGGDCLLFYQNQN